MNHTNSFEALMESLADQLEFLEHSASAYDQGYKNEVVRQASVVRLLVNDTMHSTSLLARLGRKGIPFFDSLAGINAASSDPFTGLLETSTTDSAKAGLPLLDDGLLMGQANFDSWWKATVLIDDKGSEFSRGDIVNLMANRKDDDNVDASLNSNYLQLKQKNIQSWSIGLKKDAASAPIRQLYPSMRQITHEVLKTIKVDYACHKDQEDAPGKGETRNTSPAGASSKKIGRNDPCPCGSGKKYKKCCMIN